MIAKKIESPEEPADQEPPASGAAGEEKPSNPEPPKDAQ